ncbi:filamin-A-interacting protein 1-like isoform X1 [Phyllopteryx taeniolatus]|uniref:filamin-A-interacting protein 1-like isoform X1 n=2 Tax=Phyllopteryx taeniolatus TaxID=161469 RepID=UPI002AD2F0F0|nr:filamin-A-interacting protein 1-like isoform X1 [Phyllopteryx taeniolatus]XP_061650780.1 filamin-A-interacting protein 1-like isoform X1 [Phyllopteryx taeniolatus]
MRSKSSEVAHSTNGVLGVPQGDHDISQGQNVCIAVKNMKAKVQQQEGEDNMEVIFDKEQTLMDSKTGEKEGAVMNLSREDLLKLLGIMEGEIQAREDVINMLKSKQTHQVTVVSADSSAAGCSAFQALQRDGLIAGTPPHTHSVYQKPMIELERLQEKHRETYRRMLGQLLLAEKCHRRTVHELDSEKRKHVDYMNKSDDFTNLLEQERERLKRLLDNEKAYQVKKEKEHSKRLAKVQEELVKLKSFALMLVNERQQHLEQMDQQTHRVQELSQQLQQQRKILSETRTHAQEDAHRVLSLEAELKEKTVTLAQQHEEMSTKLASQELLNRQLNSKILGLLRTVDEIEESNKALRKSEEELQEMEDKTGKGEHGNSNLITELENLRKRVLEMEGNDEEITRTENQCQELRKKLQEENNKSKELRIEVEKLQKRMIELEKLEGAFNISKKESAQLYAALEREKGHTKELAEEVVMLKIRMKELESSELKLEKSELNLKDDLGKLKSLTVALMEERKTLVERITSDEKKKEDLSKMVKDEQSKVMAVTEKLIEESKKLLKFKSEMETKVDTMTIEKRDLNTKLANETDKTKDLLSKVSQMKKRLDGLEQAERLSAKKTVKFEQGRAPDAGKREDNKIKELTFEIEHLRNRLKQLEVVEGDLIKTEDQYDILEKRFITEQDKATILTQQVEAMRSQIARNKAIEKGEEDSQEEDLRQRYKREEAKTREIQADVVALKEKIHELMHKEDQLSQLQVDYSVLQQRFFEEEEKAKSMGTEVLHLTKELEIAKRHSRALRPSLNGRRMVDVAVTSTGVQTEALSNGPTEEDTPAGFIRKSVQEENNIMNNLRQKSLKKPSEKTGGIERSPSSGSDLSIKKSWIPWMRKKDNNSHETSLEKTHVSGAPNLTMAHKQGQPLHIRLTPDHQNNMATLEISSTTAEDVFSTSAPLNANPSHPKSRITIIPTHSAAIRGKLTNGHQGPERTKSPVTITTISRAKSPDCSQTSSSTSGRPMSPVTIMTVSTSAVPDASSSPEPQEMTMGRAVFKVTPEKQMVPVPIRKGHNNTNIITTTDDNKIHIHLGNSLTPKMVVRPVSAVTESKELTLSTGTVLRSPRQITTTRTTHNKVMSTLTISPVASNTTRSTQSMCGHDSQGPRTGLTRIPMSKSLKTGKTVLGSLGISSGLKAESRAESQSMRIEVKKSVVNGITYQNGGKG